LQAFHIIKAKKILAMLVSFILKAAECFVYKENNIFVLFKLSICISWLALPDSFYVGLLS